MADEQHMGAPELATPSNPLAEATAALLRDRFPDGVVEATEHRGEMTIVVRPDIIVEVCRALRDEKQLAYNYLADITAVDWLEREPRYDIVYHLLSLATYAVVRLKVRIGGEETPDPEIPSVTPVWPGADWFEREIYDLFGIRFSGHPNQTRILMPQDWVGYPLRKDYPLTGIHLPEPHWGGQVLLEQPLPEGIGQQTLRTPDHTGTPRSDNTVPGAPDTPDTPDTPPDASAAKNAR
ncbi:MAG TPA: NADH-quinone oxidoreductase subunit C [Ktedonobacterales bacterium]|nr:NADH-quinone oxidoreductase subunit C [Ktedonobacterales bacterium]